MMLSDEMPGTKTNLKATSAERHCFMANLDKISPECGF